MEYCDRCKDLVSHIYDSYIYDETPEHPARQRRHMVDFFKFDIKVSIGCSLCALIVNSMSEDELAESMKLTDSCIYISCQNRRMHEWGVEMASLHLEIRPAEGSSVKIGDICVLLHDMLQAKVTHLPTRMVDSSSTWKLVRDWIKTCTTSHRGCQRHTEWRIPTRLVQISGGSRSLKARLVECNEVLWNTPEQNDADIWDSMTKYCTLSHCWGQIDIAKLLRCNYASFLEDIPVSSLTKTFQEALHVALTLGFSYIWIDSLCIIQDSHDDWLQQASLMSWVYYFSTLNLAATAARDGNDGLFFPRYPPSVRACTIEQPTLTGRKLDVVDTYLWQRNIDESVLSRRAWVFQERFLARRTLHFTKTQLFWECHEINACETYSTRSQGLISYWKEFKRSGDASLRFWGQVVEVYTNALLSKQEDKLIALSGIASWFHERNCDQYIAGLWLKNIVRQLYWVPRMSQSMTRPAMYRAPSWSWASLDGNVYMGYTADDYHHGHLIINLKDAKIELQRINQSFGGVKSGVLTIECWQLKRVIVGLDELGNHTMKLNGKIGLISFDHLLDVKSEQSQAKHLFLLALFQNKTSGFVYGLLVESSNTVGQYRRRGTFRHSEKEGLFQELEGLDGDEYYKAVGNLDESGQRRYIIAMV